MAAVSSLTGPALQASRAALSAALADQPTNDAVGDDDSLEPGEIQELDMQAQAESIRTVFSDPTNFNVKVGLPSCILLDLYSHALLAGSTRSTPPGRSGSIHLPPKAAICPRHQFLHFLKPLFLRHLVWLLHRAGWKISSG